MAKSTPKTNSIKALQERVAARDIQIKELREDYRRLETRWRNERDGGRESEDRSQALRNDFDSQLEAIDELHKEVKKLKRERDKNVRNLTVALSEAEQAKSALKIAQSETIWDKVVTIKYEQTDHSETMTVREMMQRIDKDALTIATLQQRLADSAAADLEIHKAERGYHSEGPPELQLGDSIQNTYLKGMPLSEWIKKDERQIREVRELTRLREAQSQVVQLMRVAQAIAGGDDC